MGNEIEFDDKLLSAFIDGFWGYGNFKGRYWFIGMEEGGGNSLEEVKSRVRLWAQRGRRELEDVAEYHRALGMPEFFSEPTTIQSTWNRLIRMVIVEQAPSPALDMVKEYQRGKLGRLDGNTCLLELMPLPSRSVKQWLYGEFSTVKGLQSRKVYRNQYAPSRAKILKARVAEYRPQIVVFYSVDRWYQQWWEVIADSKFEQHDINGVNYLSALGSDTKFFVIKHPATRGITHDYYHQVGRLLIS